MADVPINSEVKQIVGTQENWDAEEAVLSDDIIVLTRDTDIWKQGKKLKKFNELPVLLETNRYDEIHAKLIFLDDYDNDVVDTLITYDGDTGKLKRANKVIDILNIHDSIIDHSYFGNNLTILGPNKVGVGTSEVFTIEGFNQLNILGNTKLSSEWIFPDGSLHSSNNTSISYSVENNGSLVGTTLKLRGRLKDELTGIYSKWITKDILVDSNSVGYVSNSSVELLNPKTVSILSIEWNENTHYKGKRYVMTITPNDESLELIYSVKCNRLDVKIENIPLRENLFLIEYPDDWDTDVNVTYTITISTSLGEFDQTETTKTVVASPSS